MTKIYITAFFILTVVLASCASKQYVDTSNNSIWESAAKLEDGEILVDITSIKQEGTTITAREKRVFQTPESKDDYIDNIKKQYAKLGKEEKIQNWSDFGYTIYTSEYDCLNSRTRILSVEDYTTQGVRIIKTKFTRPWVDVEEDTLLDHTFFFVCDYGN